MKRYLKQGYRMAVDMDLSKFFDRVQHDVLMSRVARKVGDRRVLRLIGRYLRAGVMVEGLLQPTGEGASQGGPLSPLLGPTSSWMIWTRNWNAADCAFRATPTTS